MPSWGEIVHLEALFQFGDPSGGDFLYRCGLGDVQIRPSAAKWCTFGKFRFSSKYHA